MSAPHHKVVGGRRNNEHENSKNSQESSRCELSHNNLPPPPFGGDHPTYILLGFSAALAPQIPTLESIDNDDHI